jgi:hypothetical protein
MAFFQSRGTSTYGFWTLFAVNLGNYVIVVLALMRFGMFAAVVMIFVTNTLGDGLMTTDLSAWYGTSTWLALVVVTAVLLWGYRVATAGKSLIDESKAAA